MEQMRQACACTSPLLAELCTAAQSQHQTGQPCKTQISLSNSVLGLICNVRSPLCPRADLRDPLCVSRHLNPEYEARLQALPSLQPWWLTKLGAGLETAAHAALHDAGADTRAAACDLFVVLASAVPAAASSVLQRQEAALQKRLQAACSAAGGSTRSIDSAAPFPPLPHALRCPMIHLLEHQAWPAAREKVSFGPLYLWPGCLPIARAAASTQSMDEPDASLTARAHWSQKQGLIISATLQHKIFAASGHPQGCLVRTRLLASPAL